MTRPRPAFPGYNVSYSVSKRLVWLRVAKTGTRSLHALLRENVADYRYLERRDDPPHDLVALLAGAGLRFTIVRNPWDRVLSAWRDKFFKGSPERRHRFLRQLSLPDAAVKGAATDFLRFLDVLPDSRLFLQNVHFCPQSQILDGIELDCVARFENYNRDLAEILERADLGHLAAQIPHRNRSSDGTPYQAHYTPAARDLVGELYADDIERWSYGFEGPPGRS